MYKKNTNSSKLLTATFQTELSKDHRNWDIKEQTEQYDEYMDQIITSYSMCIYITQLG